MLISSRTSYSNPQRVEVQLVDIDIGLVKFERKAQTSGKAIVKSVPKTIAIKNSDHKASKAITKKPEGNSKNNVSAQKASGSQTELTEALNYAKELVRFIDKNQFYPKRALMMRQTGTVKVKLKISKRGVFEDVVILNKTPYSSLNRAAKDLLTQLRRFKPFPDNYKGSREFVVPIVYVIK